MTTISAAAGALGSTPTGTSTTAKPGGELGKDAFLQLLVAQMRFQNPSAPVDGQQYMAQLAQFAQVERLENIAKAQQELQLWHQVGAGQQMVGKQVTGVGPTGRDVTGVVSGFSMTATGPLLELADGTTLALGDVSSVHGAPPAAS